MYPFFDGKKKIYRPYSSPEFIKTSDLKENMDEKHFLDYFITVDELNKFSNFKGIRYFNNPINYLPPPPLSKILFIPRKSVENTVLKDVNFYTKQNKWMPLDKWRSGEWAKFYTPPQIEEAFDHIIDVNSESSILVFFPSYLSSLICISFKEEENSIEFHANTFKEVDSPEQLDEIFEIIENDEDLIPEFIMSEDNPSWFSISWFIELLLKTVNTTFNENIPINKFSKVLEYYFGIKFKLKDNTITFCKKIIDYANSK